jgi:hypothetical protein
MRLHPADVLGASVIKLQKNTLVYAPTTTLKYFFEKKPDTTETDHPDWLPYTATYTANADGFNDRYNYSVVKPAHTYRIITMGDSFTFGQYVNTADSWPEQLEDLLNTQACPDTGMHFEVINLGQPGYDAQYDEHRFELRGARYDPDLVLWFLHDERWNELMNETRLEIESRLTEHDTQTAKEKGDYSPAWGMALQYVDGKYSEKERFDMQQSIFSQFSLVYTKPLVLMALPDTDEKFKARLKYYAANRRETSYMESLPDIEGAHMLLPDGHPTKEAYTQIARSVFEYLQNTKRYSCSM